MLKVDCIIVASSWLGIWFSGDAVGAGFTIDEYALCKAEYRLPTSSVSSGIGPPAKDDSSMVSLGERLVTAFEGMASDKFFRLRRYGVVELNFD